MTEIRLLEVKDVARMLSISTRAVYRLAEKHDIPCVKWARSVRFFPEDIAQFLEKNRHKAIDSTEDN